MVAENFLLSYGLVAVRDRLARVELHCTSPIPGLAPNCATGFSVRERFTIVEVDVGWTVGFGPPRSGMSAGLLDRLCLVDVDLTFIGLLLSALFGEWHAFLGRFRGVVIAVFVLAFLCHVPLKLTRNIFGCNVWVGK